EHSSETKKKKKFEIYSKARNALKNIEGKIKTSSGSKPSAVAQAEMPIDPFGNTTSTHGPDEGPALLKIKRLDSSYHAEPNYSEPNLLLKAHAPQPQPPQMPSHVTQSESNL